MAAVTAVTGDHDNMYSQVKMLLLNGGVVAGSLDSKGHPAVRSKTGGWRSAYYILAVEMAERFAWFGVRSNMVNYLTGPMGQSTATAVVNVNVLIGTSDLSPLVGALVGDAILGRYRAFVVASFFSVLGLGCLSLSAALQSPDYLACKNDANIARCSPSSFHIIIFFSSMYLVALMQGINRPCLQAFGADQFDNNDEKERKAKASFFNWWNISLSTGVVIVYSLINYIQENLSWELSFGILSVVMLVAFLVYLLGTGSYRYPANSDQRNPFVGISSAIVKAVRSWKTIPNAISTTEEDTKKCTLLESHEKDAFTSDDLFDYEKACSPILDRKDATAILKLIPLWTTCLGFALVTCQPPTLFTKQGATMERYVSSSFQIPAASLQCLITIVTLMLLPIYDLIFVPIARVLTKNSSGITVLQRVGTGLFLSIITMIIAGFVERKRLATAVEYGLLDMPKEIVPMSIWWLAPQYVSLGASHCFALAGLQEFFYDQVPFQLKSLGVALYLSIFGTGNFLSSFLVSMIEKATSGDGKDSWFSDNLNRAHLDYFYWLLAGFSSVGFVVYVYLAKSYVYTMRATD